MTNTEREFVNKFLTLAALEEPTRTRDYFKPLEQVKSIAVTLQPLKYKYNKQSRPRAGQGLEGNEVKLFLKSVRPPRFAHTALFAANDNVSQVKERLREIEPAVSTADLRLLLKGKVLNDGMILSDLKAPEAALMVLVQPHRENAPAAAAAPPRPESDGLDVAAVPTLDVPWDRISSTLEDALGDRGVAAATLTRLQRGWDLAG
ncbi:AEL200Cp [Eremothecium gossypii ATCC 10895]|uniref:AEL200Cp n=1 Tax=Eremothecium gossypii (strain ATCC 10895 / CBS 109.51 / FGSC 9923 / NRRL Y-1056) TaxID=284811 RepID=Q758G2_EREGS|nr:AEL200Cp [Eremothecium gossypii ATCC 10895]AAS52485.1 AEL200Cp [Eremothecium gossypii ATCC 10895]AEY96784.1 FAEL200Cp [Eremothecium gossypii FDAG1]